MEGERRLFSGMLGETKVGLWVAERADGGVRMIGQDISRALKEQYGDADYEYWIDIPPGELARLRDALVAALGARATPGSSVVDLIEALYGGDSGAFEKFRTLCREAGLRPISASGTEIAV